MLFNFMSFFSHKRKFTFLLTYQFHEFFFQKLNFTQLHINFTSFFFHFQNTPTPALTRRPTLSPPTSEDIVIETSNDGKKATTDDTKSISRENIIEKKIEPPGKKRMRHRTLKRYCRNVQQDNSLMNLVFYYENHYNPDHLKGTFLEGIETNNSSTSKNRRNRKSKKTVSRDFEKNTTKKASENGKTKISSNGQSGVAATNKAKQPWWKAKSDKKENGKIKRR